MRVSAYATYTTYIASYAHVALKSADSSRGVHVFTSHGHRGFHPRALVHRSNSPILREGCTFLHLKIIGAYTRCPQNSRFVREGCTFLHLTDTAASTPARASAAPTTVSFERGARFYNSRSSRREAATTLTLKKVHPSRTEWPFARDRRAPVERKRPFGSRVVNF